ncbi:secondary thiamine-phosphate synthase enzyme YjbQ [bacterium]|nr:secondary thiamine-phosphate synthase enzyme YjbQ [bacterium]
MATIQVQTKGHYDFVDITEQVTAEVSKTAIKDGLVLLFVPGSTAALTTIEYEAGVIQDLIDVFEKWAPEEADYKHHQKWGDHNGAAHIKSALVGTDLLVPIKNSQLQLGTWQQIVLIDFDEKARQRQIIITILKN